MAIKIGANLAYNGKLPNFERDSFETKAAMKAFDENSIDEGHLSYCKEDSNIYQYKHTNAVDATTGRWRIFKTDIVVDAELNGNSTNPIQNKAVWKKFIKERYYIDDHYQSKYNAAFVFDKDYKYSELQGDYETIDLNGYTLSIDTNEVGTFYTNFINGKIQINVNGVDIDSYTIINTSIDADSDITFNITEPILYNCKISNATIADSAAEFYNCILSNCTFDIAPIMYNCVIISPKITAGTVDNISSMCNVIIDDVLYENAKIKNNKFVEVGYESNIDNPIIEGNAPSCEAVNAKFVNYLTKTDAGTTYVTKDCLNNEVNQLVEEINLKLDDTVAASTYLRKDDANTTYAKKSDITNIYKFKGTKTNYADLPKTDRATGDVWNITNANAEYGIKAGDNVAWNGTEWDNLSGTVDLSAYATTTTTDAISADVKKLMDKAFPFTVNVSIDKILAKKGTSQPVKVTITPKIGDDNTEVDAIMINGGEHHGAIPYVYSDTATTTTTYNVRADKDSRSARGSATITFVNPSYDGVVAANFTITEANIKTLTETLRSGKGGTMAFNLNNQKACIAYPKAFGAATGIKDANGFDYLASYTRSELNVNGELYYVYLLTNAVTITDMKQTIS